MDRLLCLLAAAALCSAFTTAQDWPAWRGPMGNGDVRDQPAPLDWSQDKNIKWRTSLAQPGNGSPIVSNGRVFVTMPEDEEGKGRSLYCFDRKDGKKLWVRTVQHDQVMPTHETNPHCSTTPAADGERVVVWHASAGLHCYDFDGKELWSRDLGEFRHQWGHGTSPVLHEDKVILHSGPGKESFVAAFDIATGKTIWKSVEPNTLTPEQIEKKRLHGSWCTPLLHKVGDRTLVLCGQPTRMVAYDAKDGAIVWSCSGISAKRGDLVYSSPVVADDVCHVMGGYVGPSIGIRVDGEGDVTDTHRVWYDEEVMSNCASGVAVDGHIYIPDMNSIVRCIDASTGETKWRKRVGRGSSWGSILAVNDRLYMTNQRGTTYVFAPNPNELQVVATNELGERTNSTPAVSNGEVFLRTHKALYCVADPRDG